MSAKKKIKPVLTFEEKLKKRASGMEARLRSWRIRTIEEEEALIYKWILLEGVCSTCGLILKDVALTIDSPDRRCCASSFLIYYRTWHESLSPELKQFVRTI